MPLKVENFSQLYLKRYSGVGGGGKERCSRWVPDPCCWSERSRAVCQDPGKASRN